jgi:hypothetical protein
MIYRSNSPRLVHLTLHSYKLYPWTGMKLLAVQHTCIHIQSKQWIKRTRWDVRIFQSSGGWLWYFGRVVFGRMSVILCGIFCIIGTLGGIFCIIANRACSKKNDVYIQFLWFKNGQNQCLFRPNYSAYYIIGRIDQITADSIFYYF